MIEQFKNMIGRTMVSCSGYEISSEQMTFTDSNGETFTFRHSQDCCESVGIDDVVGDISDLLYSPILGAEEISSEGSPAVGSESYTWTFYRFWTAKGTVTVKWLGTSNGYYSESVYYSDSLAA
jgi:hypothetical protein